MIRQNLIQLNYKIKLACKTYSRNASQVNLIAVSKKFSQKDILQAIEYGCTEFGENYLNEAEEKWPEIKAKFPKIKLHFIGHLQSNKSSQAVTLFDSIQTLDSEKLAKTLKKEIDKQKKNPEIFF